MTKMFLDQYGNIVLWPVHIAANLLGPRFKATVISNGTVAT